MGRREEALDAARRALEVEPHAVPELERVHAIFVSLRAYTDAVRALELKVHGAPGGLEEREAAVATCSRWRTCGAGRRTSPRARARAGEGARDGPGQPRRLRAALQLYRRLNDWRAYARRWTATCRTSSPTRRRSPRCASWRGCRSSGSGRRTWRSCSCAARCSWTPADDTLREEVERLAEETGQLRGAGRGLRGGGGRRCRAGPLAERMYLVLARVHDEQLDDLGRGRGGAAEDPRVRPDERARRSTRWRRCSAGAAGTGSTSSRWSRSSRPPARSRRARSILREIARVYDEQLGDPREAASGAAARAGARAGRRRRCSVLTALQQQPGRRTGGRQRRCCACATSRRTPEERARIQVEVAQRLRARSAGRRGRGARATGRRWSSTRRTARRWTSLERLYTQARPAGRAARRLRAAAGADRTDYRERVKVLFKSAQHLGGHVPEPRPTPTPCIEGVLAHRPAEPAGDQDARAPAQGAGAVGGADRRRRAAHQPAHRTRRSRPSCAWRWATSSTSSSSRWTARSTAYHQALELDPRCRPAMHALGMLYERSGNWPFALDMLEQRGAGRAGSTPTRWSCSTAWARSTRTC